MSKALLEVKNLHVSFDTHLGEVRAVRDVSFRVNPGEIVGIAGESGSGKSVTAMAVMGLLQPPGRVKSGSILFMEEELTKKSRQEMRSLRGKEMTMVFQDPMTSLNPVLKVGFQLVEGIREHNRMPKRQARAQAAAILEKVRIPAARDRLGAYPFEMSGGMRQRVMFAMAIANRPKLLIADEPTTALDVTIQNQVLVLMKELNAEMNSASILITHDLGVIAETCDRVLIMYGGMIMEEAPVDVLFTQPRHPYTIGLQKSIPHLDDSEQKRLYSIPGSPPNMMNIPEGCPFAPRCAHAMRICAKHLPDATVLSDDHICRCWLLDPRATHMQEGGERHV